MLSHQDKLQQKWGGRSTAIDQWLKERQALLIRFCALAGRKKNCTTAQYESDIVELCNLLMDYLSAGHFEIYDMLTSHDDTGGRLRERIYPELALTTDHALTFNDKYSEQLSSRHIDGLTEALAALGETLETRFALEDQLIHHMLEQHGEQRIQQIQQNQAGR